MSLTKYFSHYLSKTGGGGALSFLDYPLTPVTFDLTGSATTPLECVYVVVYFYCALLPHAGRRQTIGIGVPV